MCHTFKQFLTAVRLNSPETFTQVEEHPDPTKQMLFPDEGPFFISHSGKLLYKKSNKNKFSSLEGFKAPTHRECCFLRSNFLFLIFLQFFRTFWGRPCPLAFFHFLAYFQTSERSDQTMVWLSCQKRCGIYAHFFCCHNFEMDLTWPSFSSQKHESTTCLGSIRSFML